MGTPTHSCPPWMPTGNASPNGPPNEFNRAKRARRRRPGGEELMSANEPAVLSAAEYDALTDIRPAPVAPARGKVDRAYFWMIIPVLAVFGFFITLPALIGAFFSFTNYAGYGAWEFIGLNNYINIFHDPTVLQPYLFTFFLAIVCTIAVNVVGMAVALG